MPAIFDHMVTVGDSLEPNIMVTLFMYNCLPTFIKKIFSRIAKLVLPRAFADILGVMSPKNVDEVGKIVKDRYNAMMAINKTFNEKELDGYLVPGYETPAFKHEEISSHDLPPQQFILFNFLHFPVGVGKHLQF